MGIMDRMYAKGKNKYKVRVGRGSHVYEVRADSVARARTKGAQIHAEKYPGTYYRGAMQVLQQNKVTAKRIPEK